MKPEPRKIETLLRQVELATRRADPDARGTALRSAVTEIEQLINGSVDRVATLRDQLRAAGHRVSVDDRTNTAGAAAALCRSVGTIQNWRSAGRGPAWIRRGRDAWYALSDLVEMEEG